MSSKNLNYCISESMYGNQRFKNCIGLLLNILTLRFLDNYNLVFLNDFPAIVAKLKLLSCDMQKAIL